MERKMKLKPEDRVEAKYRGRGTIKDPPRFALDEPHFNEDLFVMWDSGSWSWIGPDVLRLIVPAA
jgi:hypothetical protein